MSIHINCTQLNLYSPPDVFDSGRDDPRTTIFFHSLSLNIKRVQVKFPGTITSSIYNENHHREHVISERTSFLTAVVQDKFECSVVPTIRNTECSITELVSGCRQLVTCLVYFFKGSSPQIFVESLHAFFKCSNYRKKNELEDRRCVKYAGNDTTEWYRLGTRDVC